MRLTRVPVVGITLALAFAAPAAAFRSGGLAASLRPVATTVASTRSEAPHTCQAGRNHEKTKLRLTGDARKHAVVACEQPPKSDLVTPSLQRSAPNALTAIG